ncbi:hypothetical protein [Phyllobacterium sp. P5_D12]
MTKGDDTTRADKKAKAAARLRKWLAANPLAANPPSPEQKAKAAARSRKWRQEKRYSADMKALHDANREQQSTCLKKNNLY